MLEAIAAMHRAELTSRYLVNTITPEQPNPDGTWTPRTAIKANVQRRRETPGDSDPDLASHSERDVLRAYALPEVEIRAGDRVPWDGDDWHVASVTPPDTAGSYLRIEMYQRTTALPPITIEVVRRVSGAWEDIGTFVVRKVLDARDPAPQTRVSVYEADTASGSQFTGVLLGGSDFTAVRPGDWFRIDGYPGTITYVDRSDPERIEASYRLEARGT